MVEFVVWDHRASVRFIHISFVIKINLLVWCQWQAFFSCKEGEQVQILLPALLIKGFAYESGILDLQSRGLRALLRRSIYGKNTIIVW